MENIEKFRNDMIKNSSNLLSDGEKNMLREQFITKYSKEKGWDPNNLTSNQMLEITNNSDYKNPGMLRS